MNLTRSGILILKYGKALGTRHMSIDRFILASNKKYSVCGSYNFQINNLRMVSTYEVKDEKPSLIRRALYKIPFLNINRTRIKAAGYILYENIADNIDYISFMDDFGLQDTFFSWFAITELHIWMLSARAMAEGDDGKVLRNAVVEALWADVDQRVKKLGAGSMKHHIMELSEQFQAAFIAYDEGLQSDDIVLAGALWRRFYQMDIVHVHKLEKLLRFVRKQISLLDNVSTEQLYKQRYIKWEYSRMETLT